MSVQRCKFQRHKFRTVVTGDLYAEWPPNIKQEKLPNAEAPTWKTEPDLRGGSCHANALATSGHTLRRLGWCSRVNSGSIV